VTEQGYDFFLVVVISAERYSSGRRRVNRAAGSSLVGTAPVRPGLRDGGPDAALRPD
jgi:hypothetical protein